LAQAVRALTAEAEEVRALSTKVTADAVEPIKAQWHAASTGKRIESSPNSGSQVLSLV
jgi:hypothetical protein